LAGHTAQERKSQKYNQFCARGASMMVRKDVFWDLGGFDKNFFVSFEDVDIGWRAWMWGYEVFLVPKSIVYHIGRQTIQKVDSIVSFHAVKNTLLLRLVNFETFFAIRSITVLYFVSFMRKFFGISVISDPEQSPPLPSVKMIFRGIFWIMRNHKYLIAKRKVVNSRRIRSTQDLMELGLITA
jgi:GT2 family glycosyltransferase